MKRYGNLWDKICDRTNIELAADNAMRGKSMNKSRLDFMSDRKHLLDELQKSLIDETYHFSFLKYFVVYEPKERLIHHSPFYPDKILHHCLMNVVAPLFLEKMTSDTYGSLKGRGVTMAAERISSAIRQNRDWYFVQIDCTKFYPSIDHDVCKAAVRRVIKCPKTLRMLDSIIDVHEEGLAIGVYPSQYLANLVLCSIDHWAKEELRLKYYFRYMDDMVVLVPNKAIAHEVLSQFVDKLASIKLQVKNNARIAPVSIGIDVIGYKFYPTHTALRKRIKLRMQRTVRDLEKQGVNDETFKRKIASHYGWCKHADCKNLMRTTFKQRLYLFNDYMEFKKLKEIHQEDYFGLSQEKKSSVRDLVNKEIVVYDFRYVFRMGRNKVCVKFAFHEGASDDYRYFISGGEVIKDRLERERKYEEENQKHVFPFVATIRYAERGLKSYYYYE